MRTDDDFPTDRASASDPCPRPVTPQRARPVPVDTDLALATLPRTPVDAHKYSRGVVGVCTGSDLYPGAAALGVCGALATGVGMVRYRGPRRPQDLVLATAPETVCEDPSGDVGHAQAWVIGSGMADDDETAAQLDLVIAACEATEARLVLDAGALPAFARVLARPRGGITEAQAQRTVLTPHAGELEALLGSMDPAPTRAQIEADPRRWAVAAAKLLGCTVLLKGPETVIAAPARDGGAVYTSTSGHPWLATAGSGDVLAGVLGALAATTDAPLAQTAAVAAWLHGRAGHGAAQAGPFGASALPSALRAVIADLLGSTPEAGSAQEAGSPPEVGSPPDTRCAGTRASAGPLRVLLAPDKFKGSLTAPEVATAIERGLRATGRPLEFRHLPVADGGDGTLDVFFQCGYTEHPIRVTGPDGQPTDSAFALHGTTAVVETARTSGLAMLDGRLDPLGATSRGLGEAIKGALDAGARTVIVGLGGSACTDGGAGMLEALGARLLDAEGSPIPSGGGGLRRLASADLAGLDPRITDAQVLLACDVTNPLLGPAGAAAVYGPQKGASASDVVVLDSGLDRLAGMLGRDHADSPGAGAAGGIGFAALACLGARMRPGIALVMDALGFDDALANADLVVTGEGRLDEQSFQGKAPAGVLEAAEARGVPCIAVCGASEVGTTPAGGQADAAAPLTGDAARFLAVYALTDVEPDRERCMRDAAELLVRLAQGIRLP